MNKRTIILTMLGLLAVITPASYGASGTFSGRIWNDIDRDGVQDLDEPPMSNFPILVYDEIYIASGCQIVFTNYTDSNGYYDFSHSKSNSACQITPSNSNDDYSVVFNLNGLLVVTTAIVANLMGADPYLLPYGGFYVTNDLVVATNVDIGLSYWIVGISLDVAVSNAPAGSPYFVTNGTKVTYTYRAVNTGETELSYVGVTDDTWLDFFGWVDCPSQMSPGESITFFTQQVILASVTNVGTVTAVPVDPLTCNILPKYDPVQDSDQTIVIVVTDNPLDFADGDMFPNAWEMQYGFDPLNSNAPNINSDSDWMSNYEEYLAGTNPTNPASFFPNIIVTDVPPDAVSMVVGTSTPDRVYNLWRSTNLLDDPQSWSLLPPEQTGTSAAIWFTVTNELPGAHYRTGVRLP